MKRREFLKKVGMGSLAMAATTALPAGAVEDGPTRKIEKFKLVIFDYPHFAGGVTAHEDGTVTDNGTGAVLTEPKVIVPNSGGTITSLRYEIKAQAERDPNNGATIHNTTHLTVSGPDPFRVGRQTIAWDNRWVHWNIWPGYRGVFEELQGQQRQLDLRGGLWTFGVKNWMTNYNDPQGPPDFDISVDVLINP